MVHARSQRAVARRRWLRAHYLQPVSHPRSISTPAIKYVVIEVEQGPHSAENFPCDAQGSHFCGYHYDIALNNFCFQLEPDDLCETQDDRRPPRLDNPSLPVEAPCMLIRKTLPLTQRHESSLLMLHAKPSMDTVCSQRGEGLQTTHAIPPTSAVELTSCRASGDDTISGCSATVDVIDGLLDAMCLAAAVAAPTCVESLVDCAEFGRTSVRDCAGDALGHQQTSSFSCESDHIKPASLFVELERCLLQCSSADRFVEKVHGRLRQAYDDAWDADHILLYWWEHLVLDGVTGLTSERLYFFCKVLVQMRTILEQKGHTIDAARWPGCHFCTHHSHLPFCCPVLATRFGALAMPTVEARTAATEASHHHAVAVDVDHWMCCLHGVADPLNAQRCSQREVHEDENLDEWLCCYCDVANPLATQTCTQCGAHVEDQM